MITLSKTKGIGGKIKNDAESFIVREIVPAGNVLETDKAYLPQDLSEVPFPGGKFVRFVLQKKNWGTINALREIAKKVGRGVKSIGYAGMKDRISVSTQIASVFGVTEQDIAKVHIKDISINGCWQSNRGADMGDLLGNSFSVRLDDASDTVSVWDTVHELNGVMPNYFDRQRFGLRMNNPKIGMHILNGNFEYAVIEFLTSTAHETNESAVAARNELADSLDFGKAANRFPKYLRYEKAVLSHLANNPTDYAGAIRAIPRGIRVMFVHSLEDLIFNISLEGRIRAGEWSTGLSCNANWYGFPDVAKLAMHDDGAFQLGNIIGYETEDKYISDTENEIMADIGIDKNSFSIKSMPELSAKGSFRPLFAPFKDFETQHIGNRITLSFSLPAGAYATIMLHEITKSEGLDLSQIFADLKKSAAQ